MTTPMMICRQAVTLRAGVTPLPAGGAPRRCHQRVQAAASSVAPLSQGGQAELGLRGSRPIAEAAAGLTCVTRRMRPQTGMVNAEGPSRPHVACHAASPGAAPLLSRGVPELAVAASGGIGQTLAIVVGYLVILGSLTVKVPQIVRILKKESTEGLSVTGHVAETVAYTIGFAYNLRNAYPFSTYGDIVACWIQNLIIAVLIAKYRHFSAWQVGVGVLATVGFCYFLATPTLCSTATLAALQASTLCLMILGARLPQIWLNFKRGNTGELSMITYGLQLAGNLARVFTSLMLTGDMLLIGFAATVSTCNFIILMQTYTTWRATLAAERQAKTGLQADG